MKQTIVLKPLAVKSAFSGRVILETGPLKIEIEDEEVSTVDSFDIKYTMKVEE